MAVEVIWDNDEQTVIRYRLVGAWTWEEIRVAAATSNTMLDAAGRKIDFIYDMQGSTALPQNAITRMRGFIGKEHPLTGRSVVVGAGKSMLIMLARSILGAVKKLYGTDWNFAFADTLDEARGLLDRQGVGSV